MEVASVANQTYFDKTSALLKGTIKSQGIVVCANVLIEQTHNIATLSVKSMDSVRACYSSFLGILYRISFPQCKDTHLTQLKKTIIVVS